MIMIIIDSHSDILATKAGSHHLGDARHNSEAGCYPIVKLWPRCHVARLFNVIQPHGAVPTQQKQQRDKGAKEVN